MFNKKKCEACIDYLEVLSNNDDTISKLRSELSSLRDNYTSKHNELASTKVALEGLRFGHDALKAKYYELEDSYHKSQWQSLCEMGETFTHCGNRFTAVCLTGSTLIAHQQVGDGYSELRFEYDMLPCLLRENEGG